MEPLGPYTPIILFVLAILVLLFMTAADRGYQLLQFKQIGLTLVESRQLIKILSIKRVLYFIILLYLVSFIWVYQSIQDKIADLLQEQKIKGVEIGSLVIPSMAFFKDGYTADTGFKKYRKRVRSDVKVMGYPWNGLNVSLSEDGLGKLSKITGKKFVFSYLTDVKVLKPAINQHLQIAENQKKIDGFKLEMFDNRGPYIVVFLNEQDQSKDVNQIAKMLAQDVFDHLTKKKQLKVNRVVIKIAEPEPYLRNETIIVIGRGTAGSY
jgi:hypothetical protein